MIADQPSLFGFEKSAVEEVFSRYGETPDVEGFAREELIRNLFSQGWIRIRYSQGNFEIQCDSELTQTFHHIEMFTKYLVGKFPATAYSSLSVINPDGEETMTTSINDLLCIENEIEQHWLDSESVPY
jgi:hypothetical protein